MSSVDMPQKTSANSKKTGTQGVQLIKLIIKSAKTAGILFAIWSVGFWKFSVSWVIGAVVIYVGSKEYKKNQDRQKLISALINHEEEPILARVDELPSWVYFPDVERAEWLNQMIQKMWPFIGRYVEKLLRSRIEKIIDDAIPEKLRPFKFEEINLGKMPPRIGGVKVYIDNVKRDEIVLDAELTYAGDADLNIAIKGIHAGIKDLMIVGTIRVIMRPIVNSVPIIGGLNICFLNQPNIDFDMTKVANILDMPLLSSCLRTVVNDQVATFLVLPSYILIPLGSEEFRSAFSVSSFTMPKAVVRLNMIEADDLKKADVNLFKNGSSDPYCKITAGGKTFKTKVIDSTINPRWDETFEFIIENLDNEIEIEVFDKDPTKDDKLGNVYIRLRELENNGSMDEWLKLGNVKTGRVHVACNIYYLTSDKNDPDLLMKYKNVDKSKSTALLFLNVDFAKNLPANKRALTEPSPFVNLEVGNTKYKTKICSKTTNPKWDESFYFTINDPLSQVVIAEILDSAKDNRKIGMVSINISKLWDDDDLNLCQPFALKESSADAILSMRLCMRLLTTALPKKKKVPTATLR